MRPRSMPRPRPLLRVAQTGAPTRHRESARTRWGHASPPPRSVPRLARARYCRVHRWYPPPESAASLIVQSLIVSERAVDRVHLPVGIHSIKAKVHDRGIILGDPG